MIEDIVKRLRDRIGPTVLLLYPPQSTQDPLCCEAADEIERLRAELSAAEEHDKIMWADMDAIRAERDALRELLREARNFMPFYTEELRARINAALNKGGGDGRD